MRYFQGEAGLLSLQLAQQMRDRWRRSNPGWPNNILKSEQVLAGGHGRAAQLCTPTRGSELVTLSQVGFRPRFTSSFFPETLFFPPKGSFSVLAKDPCSLLSLRYGPSSVLCSHRVSKSGIR